MTFLEQAKYKYHTANVLEKLIAINVIVFVLMYVFQAIAFLFKFQENFILDWLVFSKDPEDLLFKPWSIVTYAFLHSGILHLLGNMLILYYAGTYFITYFTQKKILNFYFLGAIVGALVYLLSYNFFPAFAGTGRSYLLGASAGVMAVLVGIATKVPNLGIRLLFIGTIKLWYIAAFFVVLDIIRIPTENAGGFLAHLGGSFFGYFYVKQLDKGNDIGKWWENFMDWFVNLFTSRKEKPFRNVHRNKTQTSSKTPTADYKAINQKKIDTILDKISKSGYDSLSKDEKDFLFKSGKED
ncbi:MAG: rhomboid family intramembrane serine protease [Bacteroidetes bacterium HGW-Bacteroidetes-2]|jgi:membrane associated rhomboid family serine protease|nr:MAG: rhomboid family intramembrane serine protease [Bacteroidetes bacterium HGW-Bacteroidetes-2]